MLWLLINVLYAHNREQSQTGFDPQLSISSSTTQKERISRSLLILIIYNSQSYLFFSLLAKKNVPTTRHTTVIASIAASVTAGLNSTTLPYSGVPA